MAVPWLLITIGNQGVIVPTTPGLEYSAAGVLDYAASGRVHYKAPVNRLHYAAPEED